MGVTLNNYILCILTASIYNNVLFSRSKYLNEIIIQCSTKFVSTLVFMGITVISPVQTAVRKIDVTLPMELVSGVHLDGLDHSVIQVSKQSKTVLCACRCKLTCT